VGRALQVENHCIKEELPELLSIEQNKIMYSGSFESLHTYFVLHYEIYKYIRPEHELLLLLQALTEAAAYGNHWL